MTDVEFARAFEAGAIPNDGFHHLDHLRLAWVYLNESASLDAATERIRSALQRFAASVGKPEKYDHPLTMFWMRVLAEARAAQPGAAFDDVLRANPHLKDKAFAERAGGSSHAV